MNRIHNTAPVKSARRGHSGGYVTRAEFEALRERLEEMEDAIIVRAAKVRGAEKTDLPAAFMQRLIGGEHPVRVWREFRGMTPDRLSRTSEVSKSYLNEVENGKKPGSVAFFKKCAKALAVDLDDLTQD